MKKQMESNKTPGNRKGEGGMWAGKNVAPAKFVCCVLVSFGLFNCWRAEIGQAGGCLIRKSACRSAAKRAIF